MYRILEYAVVVLLLGFSYVSASSAPPRPLKRVSHPSTLSLEILPRRPSAAGTYNKRSYPLDSPVLRHTDTFRLKLSAFDDTFHLHLRPNENLIHPAARIKYYTTTPSGEVVLFHTEPLLPESVKAYWGEVIDASMSDARLREDAAGVWPHLSSKPELGWARMMVHHQGDVAAGIPPHFEGAFSVNGVVHHVMSKENYLRNKLTLDPHVVDEDSADSALVIFRDSDVMTPHEYRVAASGIDSSHLSPPARTCAHDTLDFNTNPLANPTLRKPMRAPVTPWYDPFDLLRANGTMRKRDDVAGGDYTTNFEDTIGQTNGCPTTQKVVYLGVAADCEYTGNYGTAQNATQQIISNLNTASALYKSTFNVSLGIVELQVHNSTCPSTPDPTAPWNLPCSANATLNDRLSLFSQWRGTQTNDSAGLWHLMSGCPTGTEVGIAWLGTLCQKTTTGSPGQFVSGTAVSTAGRIEWQVVSHEIGHNFGAIHDCTDGCTSGTTQCCPFTSSSCDAGSQFIMNPVAETSEMKFSQCTLGNICSLMLSTASGGTNTSCLVDAADASKTISLQMCGNGIVEAGEDCDPGQGVNSTCCNAATCKFTAGAVCDPASSPCCTGQCTFAPSSQVCRPSKDATCDQAEMCSGDSAVCPADVFSPNGKSCGSDGLACASGTCTSLDKQCQTVGASMNLQKACPSHDDKSCQVSCQDPTSANQCVVLQSTLVDGSPCGYGGTCESGSCKSGSLMDTVKAWYVQNLQISIPVTVVVGIVILLILWFIGRLIYRCCSGRQKRASAEAALRGQRGQRLGSWVTPPDMSQTNYGMSYGPNVPQQYSPPIHTRGRSDGWAGPVPNSPLHKPTRSTGSANYAPY